MKQRSNLHTHTNYVDGADSPRAMIESALQKGFNSLGFSEHAYTTFDQSCCLSLANTPRYFNEIHALQQEYQDRLTVFLGLEIDGTDPQSTQGLAYSIGSLHAVTSDGTVYCPVDASPALMSQGIDEHFGGQAMRFVKAYYTALTDFLYQQKPEIIGHFDLVTKFNANHRFFDDDAPCYRSLALEAVDAALETGGIFEINTGAIARGWTNVPYPAPFLLQRIREKGGRILFSSDAHRADALDAYFDRSVQAALSAGFTEHAVLTDKGFIMQAIDDSSW